MARYDFRCRQCGETFEVTRPMSEASASASCPAGHTDTVKLLSTAAFLGGPTVSGIRRSEAAGPQATGGGCCGGGCGC